MAESPAPQAPSPEMARADRKPFRDNTRLLVLALMLLVTLAALLALASRSTTFAPDFLTEFVLYALSATNLMMLAALVFVLGRNIVKLVVERRRALPFARFRAKLVFALLAMTVVPALLVLIVGSELIRTSVAGWFNDPLDDVLSSANAMAGDYYEEQRRQVSAAAARLALALAQVELTEAGAEPIGRLAEAEVAAGRLDLVEVYRAEPVPVGPPGLTLVAAASADTVPAGSPAHDLAERAAATGVETPLFERLENRGELIRSAVPIRAGPGGPVRGVVIAAGYLTGQFATRARSMTAAYENYQQLRVLQRPLTGVYLSFFFMLTLLILVAATWTGLYIAKRITRPVQLLAAAAQEIGAGRLDHRVEPAASDELGSLIDAFNRMAGDLAASRRGLEQAAAELERKHQEVEARWRYVETILDRIAAGVVSIDSGGRIRTLNAAASRLLGIERQVAGLPAAAVFGTAELKPLSVVVDEASRTRKDLRPREVSITRNGHELHLALMTTPLRRDDGSPDGLVVMFDDVTPLVRAQRVAAWREVARRLAHEIKNPLTPIQLSAERLRRHFLQAPEAARRLVEECTTTIVGEVESLKALVDEFSQFARMPAPRAVPTDLHGLLDDVLTLYSGLLSEVELRRRYAASLPKVSVDPEQFRRVIVNLVDNAVEAMDRRGSIDIETQHDPSNSLVRVIVSDDGPGIPEGERDKLFLPYYSTKKRGSGLGLAIVRRIVAEHGGSIEVADNVPKGTRFAIELPC